MSDVIDSTLMPINQGKAYGRQGKAPTGLIFQHSILLLNQFKIHIRWPWDLSRTLLWSFVVLTACSRYCYSTDSRKRNRNYACNLKARSLLVLALASRQWDFLEPMT